MQTAATDGVHELMARITPVRSLAKEVGAALPGFTVQGRMIFATPVRYMLRGIILDSSAYSKESFYPTIFVQPLYIKSDYIFFTHGGRIKGLWNVTPENHDKTLAQLVASIREIGIPFLESLCEPIDLAEASDGGEQVTIGSQTYFQSKTRPFAWSIHGIHAKEAAAYSWCLSMRPDKSIPLLEAIHSDIHAGDDRREWVMELDRRTQSFLALLEAGDIELANEQLEQSRRETAAALKIADSLAF